MGLSESLFSQIQSVHQVREVCCCTGHCELPTLDHWITVKRWTFLKNYQGLFTLQALQRLSYHFEDTVGQSRLYPFVSLTLTTHVGHSVDIQWTFSGHSDK